MHIAKTDLILRTDGSIYHLGLFPEDIADTVLLVGDPDRVSMISDFFDSITVKKQNREFITHTGFYKSKKITVISTGIGTDNMDIVMNELDALVNVDLSTLTPFRKHKILRLIRIGTTGTLQQNISPGSYILSTKALGLDGLMHFYKTDKRDLITDPNFIFSKPVVYPHHLPAPYLVSADEKLANTFPFDKMHSGITLSASGFYAPQGREVRLPSVLKQFNHDIENITFEGEKFLNYEMECSALYGLSKLLGHKALTICVVIANRQTGEFIADYHEIMQKLIHQVLEKISISERG